MNLPLSSAFAPRFGAIYQRRLHEPNEYTNDGLQSAAMACEVLQLEAQQKRMSWEALRTHLIKNPNEVPVIVVHEGLNTRMMQAYTGEQAILLNQSYTGTRGKALPNGQALPLLCSDRDFPAGVWENPLMKASVLELTG
jgi:hypothetical protein